MAASVPYSFPASLTIAQAVESANSPLFAISSGWAASKVESFSISDAQSDFNFLRDRWHEEYGATSSMTRIVSTPTYRWIIQQGPRFVPFIIKDLETSDEPDHWFEALRQITNADPVDPRDRGNRRKMAKAWIKWYRSQGHAR